MKYGLLKSQLTGNEKSFYTTLPVSMNFVYPIDKTINLGSDPICAACATSVFLDWNYKKEFDYYDLFRKSGGTSEGTSFLLILKYLRKNLLINEYALVHSEIPLKTAILVNGPCLGGMKVRDSNRADFWNGDKLEGMHGIAIIGWNNKGFIIKNSWGEDWGNYGNTVLPYDRFSEFKELWTIIA